MRSLSFKELRQLVSSGNSLEAIELLKKEYPTVWECNWQLQLRLHCQHFIELVRRGDAQAPEALSYARTAMGSHLLEHGDNAKEMTFLQDVLGLLAYVDPTKSPVAHLLEQTQRDNTFDVLNRTLHGAWMIYGACSCVSFFFFLIRSEQ